MVLRLILRQDKKENTEITRKNICLNLWKKVSYIKNNNCAYVYVNCLRHLYECLVTCLRKSSSKTGVELLVFLTFIISFMKAFIKSIIYCQAVPLDCLLVYVVKTVCHAFLPTCS